MHKLSRIDEMTLKILRMTNRELTVKEIADKVGETPEKIQKSLRRLFEDSI